MAARFQPSALSGQHLNKFFVISLIAEPNFFAKRKEVTDIDLRMPSQKILDCLELQPRSPTISPAEPDRVPAFFSN
jgi:hypothetical protein